MASDLLVVQALYNFKATNNDELCFRKGDIITITQKEDGGWWEGTLGNKTGWFPCNYVREVKDASVVQHLSTSSQHDVANVSIVYKDLLESERAHVAELQGLVNSFLVPLEKSTILSSDEYKQMIGNFMEVLETHHELLKIIETENAKPYKEQRIGKYFLNFAARMKTVHQNYCSLHPKAVCILDKYRDDLTKYMESCGASCPGVLVLTTGLSKPFRRLAKYSGMLLEVERHVEDSHPDRGDIQRSVAVYKDMDAACAAIRRQKELELQVLTGPVRGWEGQSLSTLGEIIYMGSVAVGPQRLDRYLVLFSSTLLILSVSHRLSAFIYEGKLPVTGINVTKLEDSEQYKNAFEITGPMIEKLTAVCQSREEAIHWVDLLRKHNPNLNNFFTNKALPSQAEIIPQPPPHMTTFVATPSGNRLGGTISNSVTTSSAPFHLSASTANSSNNNNNSKGSWSVSCLRPAPPLRPCVSLSTAPNGSPNRTSRKPVCFKDDALILEVIEAFFSAKTRNTVNSVELLTGGNVKMHDWFDKSHQRASVDFIATAATNSDNNNITHNPSAAASSTLYSPLLHPGNYRPHAPRASTWCCGSLVMRQLRKTGHLN